jgi:hypothetical protein
MENVSKHSQALHMDIVEINKHDYLNNNKSINRIHYCWTFLFDDIVMI